MRTLLLDIDTWDLVIDANGDVAAADNPYALAQDAASAIKLFLGEQYYSILDGVPYWNQILGKSPPLSYMKSKFVEAALRVPNVVAARCFISSFVNREVKGQVHVTDIQGNITPMVF